MDQAATASKLRELELDLHRHAIRASRPEVSRLLAADFLEFGASGRTYDKPTVLEALADEDLNAPEPVATELAVRFLAPTVALVTYRAEEVERTTLRSSIWRFEAGEWRMAFHQGTPTA